MDPGHFKLLLQEALTSVETNTWEVHVIDMSAASQESHGEYRRIIHTPGPKGKRRIFFHTNVETGTFDMLSIGRAHCNRLSIRQDQHDLVITSFDESKISNPGDPVNISTYPTAFSLTPLNSVLFDGLSEKGSNLISEKLAQNTPGQLWLNIWGASGVGKSTLLEALSKAPKKPCRVSQCLHADLWDLTHGPFTKIDESPQLLCLHEADQLTPEDVRRLKGNAELRVIILETHQPSPRALEDWVQLNLTRLPE